MLNFCHPFHFLFFRFIAKSIQDPFKKFTVFHSLWCLTIFLILQAVFVKHQKEQPFSVAPASAWVHNLDQPVDIVIQVICYAALIQFFQGLCVVLPKVPDQIRYIIRNALLRFCMVEFLDIADLFSCGIRCDHLPVCFRKLQHLFQLGTVEVCIFRLQAFGIAVYGIFPVDGYKS